MSLSSLMPESASKPTPEPSKVFHKENVTTQTNLTTTTKPSRPSRKRKPISLPSDFFDSETLVFSDDSDYEEPIEPIDFHGYSQRLSTIDSIHKTSSGSGGSSGSTGSTSSPIKSSGSAKSSYTVPENLLPKLHFTHQLLQISEQSMTKTASPTSPVGLSSLSGLTGSSVSSVSSVSSSPVGLSNRMVGSVQLDETRPKPKQKRARTADPSALTLGFNQLYGSDLTGSSRAFSSSSSSSSSSLSSSSSSLSSSSGPHLNPFTIGPKDVLISNKRTFGTKQEPINIFSSMRSIYDELCKDPVIGDKELILKNNKYICVLFNGYTVLIEGIIITDKVECINVSLVNKSGKYMEIKEMGFYSVFKIAQNYPELKKIVDDIIKFNYNIECYNKIRKVGSELGVLGFDVDTTWEVSVMIETANVHLYVEIECPSSISDNSTNPDPQVIVAEYYNLKQTKSVRFLKKKKIYKSVQELYHDLIHYKLQ